MAVDDVSRAAMQHYRRQAGLAQLTARAVVRLWAGVDPSRISESWQAQLASAVRLVSAGQYAAAASAGKYTARQARIQGAEASGYELEPAAFAETSAFGGALSALMYLPAITAKLRIGSGFTEREGLLAGRSQLALLAGNEVQQTGRDATQAAITATPSIQGYVRMLVRPSCPRCVILAGKFYRYSKGFDRHPRCDCVHIPAAESGVRDLVTEPSDYFNSLSKAQQDAAFGKGNAQAIRDGADMSQVVNVHRKGALYDVDSGSGLKQATKEGTNVRQGRAGRRLALTNRQLINPDGSIRVPDLFERSTPRLTPRQIYKDATSRADATRLLFENGYLQPKPIKRGYRGVFEDLGADRRGFRNGLAPTYPT